MQVLPMQRRHAKRKSLSHSQPHTLKELRIVRRRASRTRTGLRDGVDGPDGREWLLYNDTSSGAKKTIWL